LNIKYIDCEESKCTSNLHLNRFRLLQGANLFQIKCFHGRPYLKGFNITLKFVHFELDELLLNLLKKRKLMFQMECLVSVYLTNNLKC